jgi:hypothetical protein
MSSQLKQFGIAILISTVSHILPCMIFLLPFYFVQDFWLSFYIGMSLLGALIGILKAMNSLPTDSERARAAIVRQLEQVESNRSAGLGMNYEHSLLLIDWLWSYQPAHYVAPKQFKYDRHLLTGNDIRLLHLEPGSGYEDKLRGQLKYCHLGVDSVEDYQALSYTWIHPLEDDSKHVREFELRDPNFKSIGPDGKGKGLIAACNSHKLWINDCVLPINANLAHALFLLRRSDHEMVLWIDAVCIDQQHRKEKAHQIQMMQKIYKTASSVIVWLGPSVSGSEAAIDTLESLVRINAWIKEQRQRHPEHDVGIPSSLATLEYHDWLTFQSLVILFNPSIEASTTISPFPIRNIKELLTRAWWGRGWVVQELACARKVLYVCGKRMMKVSSDNDPFSTFISLWAQQVSEHGCSPLRLRYRPQALTSIRERYQAAQGLSPLDGRETLSLPVPHATMTTPHLTMKDLLQEASCAHLETSNPHDKIYAFLSLVTDAEQLNIQASYEIPFQKLYTDLILKYVHREEQDLWFLSYCSNNSADRESPAESGILSWPRRVYTVTRRLPSWVPNWSNRQYCHVLGHCLISDEPFRASNRRQACAEYVKTFTSQQLHLRGAIAGTIKRVWSPRPAARIGEEHSWNRHILSRWARQIVSSVPDERKVELFTALIAWARPSRSSPLGMPQSWDLGFVRSMTKKFLANEEPLDMTTKHALPQYIDRILESTNGRAIVGTEDGRIGLVPYGTRERDRVAIFDGSSVPFIIRSLKVSRGTKVYELVGEAYVYMMMYGDVVDDYTSETIVLE